MGSDGVRRMTAVPPGELGVQEAELQGLSQLPSGQAATEKGTTFAQRGLQLEYTVNQRGGDVRTEAAQPVKTRTVG